MTQMVTTDEIIKEIENNTLSEERSFDLAKQCSILLNNEEESKEARRTIINILNNWDNIPRTTHEIWTDLIESAGFYPYLEAMKGKLVFKNTAGEIRKEFHRSKNLNKYFHEEQLIHNEILRKKTNLIVSAPTSFGKSLLIEEVVASGLYRNIVVIQPTLALLDETRKKLKIYKDRYKIIVKTTQTPSLEKGNLFLLTAERVTEYPDFPKIDFVVIDEFYKLSAKRDEERSDTLNNAFNLLVNENNAKFYLLGPNIDNISEGFKEAYEAQYKNTSFSLVDNQEIDKTSPDFGKRGQKKKNKIQALFELLLELKNEQTIIYCSSPQSVRETARAFYYFLEEKITSGEVTFELGPELSLVEWIKQNLGDKWSVIKCFRYGIGIHDAALQKHITSSIIDYFNDKKLRYLFCTTTIIEGVNTSAKNVVFFGNTKGLNKPIDYFDYSNIKGRAGRFMVHYVGRVYNFNKPPEKTLVNVDIPFFEQKEVSDEVLINIPEEKIKDKECTQYKNLIAIPKRERDIFKKNGVSIEGQKIILDILKKDFRKNYKHLCWSSFPEFEDLEYVFTLSWNLLKKGESLGGISSPRALTTVTYKYMNCQNIMSLVYDNYVYLNKQRHKGAKEYLNKTDEELFDEAVRKIFWIQRHWFYYKCPKWLNVLNSLQQYVCEINDLPAGNYTYLANKLENEFVRKNLAILIEYGIPKSAVAKLESFIPDNFSEEQILAALQNKPLLEKARLLEYEKIKIDENL